MKPFVHFRSCAVRVSTVLNTPKYRKFSVQTTTKPRSLRSNLFVPVQREVPKDAHIESHKLMVQSGLIYKNAAGIYSLLPLCLRSIEKLIGIIDEELKEAGGQKMHMPTLLPSELWKKTGRWSLMESELFKVEDKKGAEYCLGPTHEEIVTDIVSLCVSSFRQLPLKLYQITPKYRDEIRPKYGLLRGREFMMMDMYSFDCSVNDAFTTYDSIKMAFKKIFDRLGVKYTIAEADSGNIGGNKSHEFHILSEVGEDILLACNKCNYKSNIEKTISPSLKKDSLQMDIPSLLSHPSTGVHFCSMKKGNSNIHAVILLNADRQLNPFKLRSHFAADDIKVLTALQSSLPSKEKLFVCVDENLLSSPSSSSSSSPLVETVPRESVMKWLQEQPFEAISGDFKMARVADSCPEKDCNGSLAEQRGIEVGHIFYLGSKYSKPLNALFTSNTGEKKTIEMGCYGLGVTRIIAAVLENSHDSHGLIWPSVLAPYKVIIIPISMKDEVLVQKAFEIYDALEENGMKGEVILDDRDEQPGFKMNDCRFLGFPCSVVIGRSFKDEGKYELHFRKTGEKKKLSKEEVLREVLNMK